MKTYEYKGFDSGGRSSKGLVEALSVKSAREKLLRDGILAESVSLSGKKIKVSTEARANMYRELSALLDSGMTLDRSLEMLVQAPELASTRVLLAGVRDRVRDGDSLADAMFDVSSSLSIFEHSIIEAAEKSATVEVMLERLATFLDEQEELKGKINNALIYPSIVTVTGVCVAILMLELVVPRTTAALTGSGAAIPPLTEFMVSLAGFIARWGWMLLCIGIVSYAYLRAKLKLDSGFAERWDRGLFQVPFFGRGYTALVNLRFSRTFSILIGGGVTIVEALAMAGKATGSAWVAHLSAKESEDVRHGSSLSDAVRRIPPLSGSLPAWIQVGEASGSLGKTFDSAASRFQRIWDRYTTRCLSYLEPLLILLVGVFVLLITLSVLLPVMSLSNGIS